VESKSNRKWIWLTIATGLAILIFVAVRETQARRAAIRGAHHVDFSR
jgi:hypothetical protein